MTFCLRCNRWLPYCRCVEDAITGEISGSDIFFGFDDEPARYEEAVRSYKNSITPQPLKPVFTPEDAIYAHSLGVLL